MRLLEKAVQDLAVALDELSAKAEIQRLYLSEEAERDQQRQSYTATLYKHANNAAIELAGVIEDLKALRAQEAE